MIYQELYSKAEALVEKQREEYALEKLTSLMEEINQQEMIMQHTSKVLTDLKEDMMDLCTHRVGYPSTAWTPLGKGSRRPPYPPGTVLTNIE